MVLFKALLKENDVSVDIITTWPPADNEITFGGREVEEILCNTMLNEIMPGDEEKRRKRQAMHVKDFKKWKEQNLSPSLIKKEILYNPPDCILTYMDILGMEASDINPIDQNRFEHLMGSYIEQFPKLINECLDYSRRQKEGIKSNEDVDLVIVTGGHSQWYFVDEMLLNQRKTPKGEEIILPKLIKDSIRLIHTVRPQETVANGMAYKGFPLNIKTIAANSVWLSLRIGNEDIESLLLIEKDTVLPITNKIVLKRKIKAEFSTNAKAPNGSENHYAIPCISKMYVGEILETAKIHKMDLKIENFTWANIFSDFIAAIQSKEIFYKEYDSTITINVEIGEQQNINMYGEIVFSNKSKLKFTY